MVDVRHSQTMTTPDWPFDQERNVATVVSRGVIFENRPVLLVVHYSDDHSWGFFDGEPFGPEDAALVSMANAVGLDRSLMEVADLPPGWRARRDHVGGEWTREIDPEL